MNDPCHQRATRRGFLRGLWRLAALAGLGAGGNRDASAPGAQRRLLDRTAEDSRHHRNGHAELYVQAVALK